MSFHSLGGFRIYQPTQESGLFLPSVTIAFRIQRFAFRFPVRGPHGVNQCQCNASKRKVCQFNFGHVVSFLRKNRALTLRSRPLALLALLAGLAFAALQLYPCLYVMQLFSFCC